MNNWSSKHTCLLSGLRPVLEKKNRQKWSFLNFKSWNVSEVNQLDKFGWNGLSTASVFCISAANFGIHHQVVPVVEWKFYLGVIWTFNIPARINTIIVGLVCSWWSFTATFASFSSSWSSLTLCNSNKKWLLSIIKQPALEQGVYPCLR